ncbi:MAG: hypothetical protein RLZZ515_1691 [Cyanobacteriota bacterium]
MDPLLRPSEQTSELGRVESSWQQVEGLSQPKGGEWKPDDTLGADAELSRSLTKVVQQLQWLQAQREATAIDGQVLSSSIEELVLPERVGGASGSSDTADAQPRLLLVLHTGVGNWQQLAANLPPETDLLLLDQQHSGLQQIGEHLSHQAPQGGYGGLMLVLPPGQAGCLELGSDHLQQAQLNGCREQLSQWSRGLQAGAPLTLVVGGTPADHQALEPLLQELAALTNTEAQLAAAPVDTASTAIATAATSTAVSIGPAAPELLAQARADLQRALLAGRLQTALVQAYGTGAALEVEAVLQLFLKGELEPQLHRARIDAEGINGAFVASHDLILVNQQLELQPGLQRAVVLEELGHWLEQRAGLLDSVGDEGQRLAVALLGQSLSRQSLEGSDDDHTWLQVGDARVAVELSSGAEAPSPFEVLEIAQPLDAAGEASWQAALEEASALLQQLAQDSTGAAALFQQAFADGQTGLDAEGIDAVLQQIRTGELRITVELRAFADLQGHLAAYTTDNGTGAERIYVNRDWINLGIGQQTPPVASVLMVSSAIAKCSVWETTRVNIYFIGVLFAVLMLVTYVPITGMGLVEYFYR